MFLARLQPHVIESPNFNPLQSAYRPSYSTETSLLLTLNNIFTASDSGRPTVLVALDLSAAFDTIEHGILLNRLSSSFGITGPAISWLHSYLTNRTQQIHLAGSSSDPQPISAGVPQGSVLGPLLFSLYVSPFGQLITSHGIMHQQYADDTQLYLSLTAPELRNSIQTLQNCLSQLQTWLCLNGLSLNAEKSEVILFGTRQRLCSFPAFDNIFIDGINVPVSDSLKTLGVTLDTHLSMDKHVLAVSRTCNFHLRALRLIRPALTLEMASTIASSLIHSRLDYANAVLFGISNKNLNKLQHIQNSLARTVLQEFSRSTELLLHDLHWLPIRKRIDFKIACLTYNAVNYRQPVYLSTLLTPAQGGRSLRSTNQQLLKVPFCSTHFGSRAFSVAAPKIWNNIPLDIRNSPSLLSFKSRLKTHCFSN